MGSAAQIRATRCPADPRARSGRRPRRGLPICQMAIYPSKVCKMLRVRGLARRVKTGVTRTSAVAVVKTIGPERQASEDVELSAHSALRKHCAVQRDVCLQTH